MTLTRAAIGYVDTDDPGEPSTGKPRLSISDQEASILSALAAGRRVYEIGTGLGVSTRALARWATEVVTQDVDPWVAVTIAPTLDLANVTCVQDRDERCGVPFDLVFIDGNHTTSVVREDIQFARSLRPDVIVMHDAHYDNVKRALHGDWLILDTEHGLAIGR